MAASPLRPHAFAPALFDREQGRLFRELRHVLRLTPNQLAARLDTRREVIEALEAGDVHGLPSWPETVRVVRAFTGLARIDPGPVLHLIREQMGREAAGGGARRGLAPFGWKGRVRRSVEAGAQRVSKGLAGLPGASGRVARFAGGDPATGLAFRLLTRKGRRGLLLAVGLPVAIYLLLAQGVGASYLAGPLAGMAHSVDAFVRAQLAPRRDGFVWIDVPDPRTRRADRLQTGKRKR